LISLKSDFIYKLSEWHRTWPIETGQVCNDILGSLDAYIKVQGTFKKVGNTLMQGNLLQY